MKNLIFFDELIIQKKNSINFRKLPKVGDNLWIKYIYVQGIKVLRFYSKTFFGRCIKYKHKNSNTGYFQLRNVYNKNPIELSFFFNSPFIITTKNKRKDRHSKFVKNKLYYLRYKKLSESKVKR